MSFGGQGTSSGLKKFETEEEVEERKRIRQEQWEKVRKPDDPLERPEEDTRSLFEKLQEQRDRKQQEYEEQFKFSNAVKGLEEDEAEFLDHVSQRQMEIEKERLSEETSILREMRDNNVTKLTTEKSSKETEKTIPKPTQPSTSRKSQQSLLMGAVKRKSSDTSPSESKKVKPECSPGTSTQDSEDSSPVKETPAQGQGVNGVARVIGILPGIGNYSDDETSDSNSSNSSDDLEDLMSVPQIKRVIIKTKEC